MKRRWLAFGLSFVLLAGTCVPARAAGGVDTLDEALKRWLDPQTSLRLSATLQLDTLMPFGEDALNMLNAVLKHVTVNAAIDRDGDNSETTLQIALDATALMEMTERLQDGQYEAVTSLLPNRTLTAQSASPMELLTAEPATPVADEGTEPATSPEDAGDAFRLLDAIPQLQACYQALTDGIQPFAVEKAANYTIKGIGAGRWSRIARLTPEQSEGVLAPLRALLSCGMDDAYRAEIAQATVAKGFIVALYRTKEGQDLCVYLKGNLVYPDGDKRKLVWQWAFNTNGLERKDTFKYEVSRVSGTADSRTITASATQESRSDAFTISARTETTLKRAKITDKSIARVELTGKTDAQAAMSCKGELSQALSRTQSGETEQTGQSAKVNLQFTPTGETAVLSGSLVYQETQGKTVQTGLTVTLAEDAPQTLEPLPQADSAPAQTPEPATSEQGSSMEQIADFMTEAPSAEAAAADAYLVGAAPLGVQVYPVPATPVTIPLDTVDASAVEALMAEAAQALAVKLIPAMAGLPLEDAALLKDGMTDTDYAAFLALLEAL